MFRRLVNELTVAVTIKSQGESALLVKDGRYTAEVKKSLAEREPALRNHLPDALFMASDPITAVEAALLSARPTGRDPVQPEAVIAGLKKLHYYVPGSSIRGAWRSHLEKVLRSLDEEPKVCDPLVAAKEAEPEFPALRSCSEVLANEEEERPEFPYHDSCSVCRLFGNTALGGRLSFSDAKWKAGDPDLIDGISISRFTGSVANKYRTMALRNSQFALTLRLRNFELWHAGLLAHLFDDLSKGRVPLGSGRSKGLGAVTATATSIEFTEFGPAGLSWDGKLRGLAERCSDKEIANYGFLTGTVPPAIETKKLESPPWRHAYEVTSVPNFWEAVKTCFNEKSWAQMRPLKSRRMAAEQA
jgi:CRISPR/Cas system CSM-associated protein Csm3 (group 7 of RAMP superfamily)